MDGGWFSGFYIHNMDHPQNESNSNWIFWYDCRSALELLEI
jgi:hypothetical protein